MIAFAHALWSLMDMEITSVTGQPVDRHAARRGCTVDPHAEVRVVQLRRAHNEEPPAGRRDADWGCCWIVRGHRRRLPDGRTTWVRSYIKGPEGKPLKVSDVVYRLER